MAWLPVLAAGELLRQCGGRELLPNAKTRGIRWHTYLDREEARRDVFNYTEMFHNPNDVKGYANSVSPIEFENQHSKSVY